VGKKLTGSYIFSFDIIFKFKLLLYSESDKENILLLDLKLIFFSSFKKDLFFIPIDISKNVSPILII